MADDTRRMDDVAQKTAEAAAALEALKAPAENAADAIETAFGRAGNSLARSLARAASDGEVSLAELARAVLNAVNAAAGAKGGLSGAIQAAMSSFGGARADGGVPALLRSEAQVAQMLARAVSLGARRM